MQPAAAMLDGSLDLETGIETEKRREMTNLEFANGLRLIADFYEKHETMEQFGAYVFLHEKEQFLKTLGILTDGGKVTKDLTDNSMYGSVRLRRSFGQIEMTVSCDKALICKRTVTYQCPDSLLEEAMNAEETAAQ